MELVQKLGFGLRELQLVECGRVIGYNMRQCTSAAGWFFRQAPRNYPAQAELRFQTGCCLKEDV
jgi:hypothetical protein